MEWQAIHVGDGLYYLLAQGTPVRVYSPEQASEFLAKQALSKLTDTEIEAIWALRDRQIAVDKQDAEAAEPQE